MNFFVNLINAVKEQEIVGLDIHILGELIRRPGSILGRLFEKCMMCSWDFSTQRTLGLLGAEQKLEEKDYLIDLKPLRAYVTEAFVEECQKYEEWIYLCLKIVLAEENLGLSLAYFV